MPDLGDPGLDEDEGDEADDEDMPGLEDEKDEADGKGKGKETAAPKIEEVS